MLWVLFQWGFDDGNLFFSLNIDAQEKWIGFFYIPPPFPQKHRPDLKNNERIFLNPYEVLENYIFKNTLSFLCRKWHQLWFSLIVDMTSILSASNIFPILITRIIIFTSIHILSYLYIVLKVYNKIFIHESKNPYIATSSVLYIAINYF